MSSESAPGEQVEPEQSPDNSGSTIPWQQRLYQNIWLWAVAAILFWFLSYVVWGWVDLALLPEG
ncbi:MAG: hypothetical protein R3223_09955 [Longimicrobiales bacterium]|nr:hypothetical protein [Longimicrobiales bacterium]